MLELSKLNDGLANYSDEAFKAATEGGGGMPKLALKTSNSDVCKDGTFPVNHFALELNKDKRIDLGKEVPAIILQFRAFALDWSVEGNTIATADHTSADYKRIKALVESGKKDIKALCGPEFLVYLPNEKKFAHLLLSGWNAKKKGADYFFPFSKGEGRVPVLIKAQKAENKNGPSFYPICEKLLTDVDMSGTTNAECNEQILKFMEIAVPNLAAPVEAR